MSETINLIIDEKQIAVPKGTTVFSAAKELEIPIPIFCYHDRMSPFGACRVCLVEVEGEKHKLEASCTLEAREGMVIRTQSQRALEGREAILELLLINHPLDCPVCDRGGECPLQEHAMDHGPGKSVFVEEKRHFVKPVSRGPVLMLDRERCIACARCTRFGELVSGDHALELIDRGYKLEVGTPDGGPVKSKFIGNTIMICPVGALTSQVYRFRARPWDNDSVPTTCTLCPVGCSMILDTRDNEVVRTRSNENQKVNDVWLCDKGWFGYEFSDHPDRLKKPLMKKDGELKEIEWEEAISIFANQLRKENKIAALGGNTLTLEENFLLEQLMREGLGVPHLDHRVGEPIFERDEEGLPPGMEIDIGEIPNLSYVVLLGLDVTEEFPVIWLQLKEAMHRGAKVFYFGHFAPEIATQLTEVHLHPPGEELECLAKVQDLAGKGALFVGRGYLQSPLRAQILSELIKMRSEEVSLNVVEGRNNSIGARFAGMHPECGPIKGLNTLQILEETAKNGWDLLYAVGADIAKFTPNWKEVRKNLGFLVVQDLFLNETAKDADLVLPTLCFLEKRGHHINLSGRVQPLLPGKQIPEGLLSDSEIFYLLADALQISLALKEDWLLLEKIPFDRPVFVQNVPKKIEGELRATFSKILFDRGERMKHNQHLMQCASRPFVRIHPTEGQKKGLEDKKRVKLTANGESILVPVKWDKDVALQTVVIPLGFEEEIPVHQLGMNLMNGLNVELEKV